MKCQIGISKTGEKRGGVTATIWTKARGNKLTSTDVETFNEQYPELIVKRTEAFHDRYLILDGITGYHVGASLKDAGRKCFGINRLMDAEAVNNVLLRLGCQA